MNAAIAAHPVRIPFFTQPECQSAHIACSVHIKNAMGKVSI